MQRFWSRLRKERHDEKRPRQFTISFCWLLLTPIDAERIALSSCSLAFAFVAAVICSKSHVTARMREGANLSGFDERDADFVSFGFHEAHEIVALQEAHDFVFRRLERRRALFVRVDL